MADQPKPSPNPPASKEHKPLPKPPSPPGQGIKPGETKTSEVGGVKGEPGRSNVTETTSTPPKK